MRAAGIVLCGGKSERMGRAKAWLPWRGQPMVSHVVGVLLRVVDEVVVVASEELDLPPLEARVVRDREPALGPLAGIREGLAQIEAELAYVTGTDAPFLTPAFVQALLCHQGAAALELDGYVQTLAAVYPRAGLPRAEALLETGRMRPLHLLEAMDYRKLGAHELPDLDSVRGFNTPAEYLRAVREWDGDATATLAFRESASIGAGPHVLAVPVGTLTEVLAHAPRAPRLLPGEDGAEYILASFGRRRVVRDGAIPIGPGEQVIVPDAFP